MTTIKNPVSITFSPIKSISSTVLPRALTDLAHLSASPLIASSMIGVNGNDESVGVRSGSYKLAAVLAELSSHINVPAELNHAETLLDKQNVLDEVAAHTVLAIMLQDEAVAKSKLTVDGATEDSVFMDGTWAAEALLFTLGKLIDISMMMGADDEKLKELGVFGA